MQYSNHPKPVGVESLLSQPCPATTDFNRKSAVFMDNCDRFRLKDKNFQRQYAHLYSERLMTMQKTVLASAKKRWGSDIVVKKLHELNSDEKCVVIGTLFKHMELQPNILKEISTEHGLLPQPVGSKFTSVEDKLILEDELQRIILVGELKPENAVTGVVVAVYGHEPEEDKGKFHVTDYCFQELPKQQPLPSINEDRYLAFVSGLEVGSMTEQQFAIQMFIDLVTGYLGDPCQQEASANIVGVVIAGNSLSKDTQTKDSLTKAKYLTRNTVAGSVEAVKCLDDFLVQLAASVDVILMPGEYDPSNYILPQQSLHKCMFPQTAQYSTLHCATNPVDCTVDGVRILGTSGQPVDDIFRYSQLDVGLDILDKTLEWGHLVPTAPDTLGCYPFYDVDPYILHECPHVLFAGNQSHFKHKIHKGASGQHVLVLTIPKFCQSRTIVLVNLRTLEAYPMVFQSGMGDDSIENVSPIVGK